MELRQRWVVGLIAIVLSLAGSARESAAYVIVKMDGTRIEAAGPFEVKDGKVVFRLAGAAAGAVSTLPAVEVDLPATEAANLAGSPQVAAPPPTTTPATPANRPGQGTGPVFDTREISSILESDDMKAERERIKALRAAQHAKAIQEWEAAHAEPPPAPPTVAQVSSDEQALARTGKIKRGMSVAGVVMAWGDADKKTRTAVDGTEREIWTYLVRGKSPFLVTLAAGKVVQIQSEDRLLFVASQKEAPSPSPTPAR